MVSSIIYVVCTLNEGCEHVLRLRRCYCVVVQVHTNGSHQNGKRGSHVSTVSIYRQEEPAMGGMSGDEPEPGIGMCGWLLTSISWFVVIITLPFSLCVCFKVSGYEGAECNDYK